MLINLSAGDNPKMMEQNEIIKYAKDNETDLLKVTLTGSKNICSVVANYDGWITAVNGNTITRGWAGDFTLA
jgi:hypothetical protein